MMDGLAGHLKNISVCKNVFYSEIVLLYLTILKVLEKEGGEKQKVYSSGCHALLAGPLSHSNA